MINVKLNIVPPYEQLLTKWNDYYMAFLGSGRATGKSESATRAGVGKHLSNDKFTIALLRSESTRLEQGIFKLFRIKAEEINDKTEGLYSKLYEVLDTKIKNKRLGNDVIFNYGLKSSQSTSLESKKGKVKGLEKINLAIIEEAQDIKDFEIIKTLIDTCIREKDFKIWFLFNPPKERDHWLYQYFYDLEASDYEGYDYLKPKEQPNVLFLSSDYTQNPHLNAQTIERFNSYKNSPNPDDYYHDILGLVPRDAGGRRIVKRFHNSSYKDENNNIYHLKHPFINRMFDLEGYLFASFDGGEHTNRKACVLGYHVERYRRDIILKEFYNLADTDDLREVALQVREYIESQGWLYNLKLYGDPTIFTDGVHHLIENIFDKKLNTMQHFKDSQSNAMLREIYQNRKKKRLARLNTEMYDIRSDNKPAIILLKDTCNKLYKGFIEGMYRYDINSNNEPIDSIEQFKDGEYKHLTDICDAYTYYLLAERPFTLKENTERKKDYRSAGSGW